MFFIAEKSLAKAPGWSCGIRRFVYHPTKSGDECQITLLFEAGENACPMLDLEVAITYAIRSSHKFGENPYKWDNAPQFYEIADWHRDRNAERHEANKTRSGEPIVVSKGKTKEEEPETTGNPDFLTSGALVHPSKVLLPTAIQIPGAMLEPDPYNIESHPAFRGIYGRAPHIRRILMAVESFRKSHAKAEKAKEQQVDLTRNHVLLFGPPAGGKGRIKRGLQRLLPYGTWIDLDMPSLTAIGLVKLFTETYSWRCPPIVFLDEIEKADKVAVVAQLIQMLDERAQVSRITARSSEMVEVPFLMIAFCNDKEKLDKYHDGAVGSRFGHEIYFPRPNDEEMRLILHDRVNELDGDAKWVEACMLLAQEFDTNDPRKIKAFMDYGKWLHDESTLREMMSMDARFKDDVKNGRHRKPKGRGGRRTKIDLLGGYEDEEPIEISRAREDAKNEPMPWERNGRPRKSH
jgi:hypothetical protein